ncbi:transcriptional regulator [Arthrobacter sp. RIT-PI-e]|uniref:TetR/AcrR family transcriptional regulator n=1 Tax=Arthrobacter sp. RIT-PI-e TaxID=1681197 RepID=UPI0006764AB9|nr:TetR/AcrR family transcriptional regulator [Arthrobacter sp. RIT-PI-e]KNC19202.1 transcriptional regulator [Arthrobacter sp. RIT-PI-e]
MNEDDPVIGRRGSYAKGVARRREILDRAIEVFAEQGAAGTSLRQIAQRIGVSNAALLHYFDSREQLLVAVFEHAERSRTPEAHHAARTAVEVLVDAAVRNVTLPGMVELYSTLVAASLETSENSRRRFFVGRFDRVRADLVERLVRDQRAGRIRADVDAAEIAALLVAASDGLQIQWLLEPSIDLERTMRTFAVLLAP